MRAFLISALFAVATALPMLAAVTHSGLAPTNVIVVTETKSNITSSTSFVQLPGAVIHITVPAGTIGLVRASFTAESACEGKSPGTFCSVRIVAVKAATGYTAELSPKSGLDYAFDTVGAPSGSSDFFEGHAMDRSLALPGGDWAIRVQWAVLDSATSFWLDDWSFTVQEHPCRNSIC